MADDWHLRDWLHAAGKSQHALVTELGWPKNKAHRLWHGLQPYRRKEVEQVSAWLGIEPYELLMAPGEAERVRALVGALTDTIPPR